jgi:hypothetical protein
VTLNAPTPVDVGSTLISSPAATLQHTGGTFTVGSLAVAAVGVGRYRITSGTLIVNQLSVGRALSFSFPLSGDGLFEQSGGWVNVIGAQTYVGHRAGSPAGTVTGTLNVSGPSRYSAVPPPSGQQVHYIGVGTGATGTARFSGFASVTLGRAEIGGDGGTGTVTVDTGAKLALNELYVGQSGSADGNGTLIISGGGSTRLTLGTGNVRITGGSGGSGNVLVNGGTVTLAFVAPPMLSSFIVGPGGAFTANGGAVESQRQLWVNGGQFIVNNGAVSTPIFRVGPAGFTPPGGALALNGGRLAAGSIFLSGGNYVQTGGDASIGLMQMESTGETTIIRPTAHLAGGTFAADGLYINSGTFTYARGVFDVGYLSIAGARFLTTPGR